MKKIIENQNNYLVATMRKFKAENLKGIQRHNQRENEHHSNREINPEFSQYNFDLINQNSINYRDNILSYIDEHKKSPRKIRKDATVVNEWVISASPSFFDNLNNMDELQDFFQANLDFFKERFGVDNARYASVHLDETTPHMHLGITPMSDGKLTGKTVFDRTALRSIQDDLPEYLASRGFTLTRGNENSERKKLTVPEYKHLKAEERTLHQQINSLKKERDSLTSDERQALEGATSILKATFWKDDNSKSPEQRQERRQTIAGNLGRKMASKRSGALEMLIKRIDMDDESAKQARQSYEQTTRAIELSRQRGGYSL